jgi:hypothetical protein
VRRPLLAGLGALALFFRVTVPMMPWFHGWSLNRLAGVCGSGLGQFAQALDAQTAAGCGRVAAWMDVLNFAAAVGVFLLVAAGVLWFREMRISVVRK